MKQNKMKPSTYALRSKFDNVYRNDSNNTKLELFFDEIDKIFSRINKEYNIQLLSTECMVFETADKCTTMKSLIDTSFTTECSDSDGNIKLTSETYIADKMDNIESFNKYFISRNRNITEYNSNDLSIKSSKNAVVQSGFYILPNDKFITMLDIYNVLSIANYKPIIYDSNTAIGKSIIGNESVQVIYDEIHFQVTNNVCNISLSTNLNNTVAIKNISIDSNRNATLVDIFETDNVASKTVFNLIERYIFPTNDFKYFYIDSCDNIEIRYFQPNGLQKSVNILADDIFNYNSSIHFDDTKNDIDPNRAQAIISKLKYNKFDLFTCEYANLDQYTNFYIINSNINIYDDYESKHTYICNLIFESSDTQLEKDIENEWHIHNGI